MRLGFVWRSGQREGESSSTYSARERASSSPAFVVGVLVAVGLRGVASTLLFGVTAGDPLTYLMAAAVFPQWRAAVTIPRAAHRWWN